MIFIIIAYSLH